MLGIYLNHLNIIKEEAYLNRKAAKGWLVSQKHDPFYQFKEAPTGPVLVSLDLAAPDISFEQNIFFHLLFTKKIVKSKLAVFYYYTDDPDLIELTPQRDNDRMLTDYTTLSSPRTSLFNVLLLAWTLFWGISIVLNKGSQTTLPADYSPYYCYLLSAGSPSVKLLLKDNLKHTNLQPVIFQEKQLLRYLVITNSDDQCKLQLLTQDLDYLGKWDYRHSNKNVNYYYLYSASNEDTLKQDISCYFGNQPHDVNVISSAHLFPIGCLYIKTLRHSSTMSNLSVSFFQTQ